MRRLRALSVVQCAGRYLFGGNRLAKDLVWFNLYRRAARAIDAAAALPCADANRIAVCGGSQGGRLSIVVAVPNHGHDWWAAFDRAAYRWLDALWLRP